MAPSSPPLRSTPDPGPDADAAFTFGLATSLVLSLLAIALSVWSGGMTLLSAVVLAVVSLPAVFVLTACLLAVWLGYDRDAIDAHELTESRRDRVEGKS